MRRKRVTPLGLWQIAQSKMKPIHLDEVARYAKYFSEQSFGKKLRIVGRSLGENILLPVLRTYFVLKSPQTSTKEKLFLLGALGYFILPLDLIPDFLPGLLGFTDDLVVITLVLKHLKDALTPEIEQKAHQAYRRIIRPCAGKSPMTD